MNVLVGARRCLNLPTSLDWKSTASTYSIILSRAVLGDGGEIPAILAILQLSHLVETRGSLSSPARVLKVSLSCLWWQARLA